MRGQRTSARTEIERQHGNTSSFVELNWEQQKVRILRTNDPRGVCMKEHHLLFCTIILLRPCMIQISLSAIELKIALIDHQTKRADPVPYFGQTVFDNELSSQPQDRFRVDPDIPLSRRLVLKYPAVRTGQMRDIRKSDNLHENSS